MGIEKNAGVERDAAVRQHVVELCCGHRTALQERSDGDAMGPLIYRRYDGIDEVLWNAELRVAAKRCRTFVPPPVFDLPFVKDTKCKGLRIERDRDLVKERDAVVHTRRVFHLDDDLTTIEKSQQEVRRVALAPKAELERLMVDAQQCRAKQCPINEVLFQSALVFNRSRLKPRAIDAPYASLGRARDNLPDRRHGNLHQSSRTGSHPRGDG